MTTTAEAKLLTIAEALAVLRVSRTTLYELMNDGDLPVVKIRGRRFVRDDDLAALIAKNTGRFSDAGEAA